MEAKTIAVSGPKRAVLEESVDERSDHVSTTYAVTVATLSCAYHLLVAIASLYLSDGPLYVGTSVALYAWASLLWSMAGLIGTIQKDASLITSFSQFLLLDTFVSTVCRLIVLQFFFDTFSDQNVCPAMRNPAWSAENFHHDLVTSVEEFRADIRMNLRLRRECRVQLGAVQVGLVGVLVCLAAAQGAVAVSVRRYGQEVGRRKAEERRRSAEVVVVEKEKASVEHLEG